MRMSRSRPRKILLDLDNTDDPTHGQQEFTFFHGYFGSCIYHPLLVFDGETGGLRVLRAGGSDLHPGLSSQSPFGAGRPRVSKPLHSIRRSNETSPGFSTGPRAGIAPAGSWPRWRSMLWGSTGVSWSPTAKIFLRLGSTTSTPTEARPRTTLRPSRTIWPWIGSGFLHRYL